MSMAGTRSTTSTPRNPRVAGSRWPSSLNAAEPARPRARRPCNPTCVVATIARTPRATCGEPAKGEECDRHEPEHLPVVSTKPSTARRTRTREPPAHASMKSATSISRAPFRPAAAARQAADERAQAASAPGSRPDTVTPSDQPGADEQARQDVAPERGRPRRAAGPGGPRRTDISRPFAPHSIGTTIESSSASGS